MRGSRLWVAALLLLSGSSLAQTLTSCREPLGPSLRVAKQEPAGDLEAILSWQPHPFGRGYEIVRCDAAANYPCTLAPWGTSPATEFTDLNPPSDLHWYQVLALVDDRYEENDLLVESPELDGGTHADLIRCPGDPDWFLLRPSCVGGLIDVTAAFASAEGDLDLALYDGLGNLLAESATLGDSERLSHAALDLGDHLLEVSMPMDDGILVGSAYELQVSLGDSGGACLPDRYEPNRDAPSARPIDPGVHAGLTACDERDGLNNDFYAIEVTAGQTIDVLVEFQHSRGDIDLNLYDTDQARIAQSQSATDDEQIVFADAPETGTYLIQVFLFRLAECSEGNDYDLTIELR